MQILYSLSSQVVLLEAVGSTDPVWRAVKGVQELAGPSDRFSHILKW